jgi:hypothetical protein
MANRRAADYYTRNVCPDCGGKKSGQSVRCASCAGVNSRKAGADPTPEEILARARLIRMERKE